jgi:hypothetical protein
MFRSKHRSVAFSLIAALAISAAAWVGLKAPKRAPSSYTGTSFASLRAALYANPRSDLPAHPGLDLMSVVKNMFLDSADHPSEGLGIQSRRVFVDESDVRPTVEPKWLHPRGACAEARWIVTEPNPATGLFAAGTNIPALVRISSGDKASEYPTDGRIFGMALKLFPTTDLNQAVNTTNMITLDQYGLERSKRPFLFVNEPASEPVYFTNVAPAKSGLGKFLSKFFDRFDKPNFARPVYATAQAKVGGGEVEEFVTPYEVRFVASTPAVAAEAPFPDFRNELLTKQKRTLDIVIQSMDGNTHLAKTIGRLEFGDFVVSDFCDLSLGFHHSPIEDQWTKYSDYRVVNQWRGARAQ